MTGWHHDVRDNMHVIVHDGLTILRGGDLIYSPHLVPSQRCKGPHGAETECRHGAAGVSKACCGRSWRAIRLLTVAHPL